MFKVGDEVVVIEQYWNDIDIPLGSIGIISSVTSRNCWVKFPEGLCRQSDIADGGWIHPNEYLRKATPLDKAMK